MRLGSRRRFLFRGILYSLAPCIGLYVLLANSDQLEGRLLGLIGIGVGALALSMFFTQLKDPLRTIRYSLEPVQTVSKLLTRWDPNPLESDATLQRSSLGRFLQEMLPDVEIGERHADEGDSTAVVLGEDLLLYVSRPLVKLEDIEALREAIEKLRIPWQQEALLIVVLDELSPSLKAQLLDSLSGVHLCVKRS